MGAMDGTGAIVIELLAGPAEELEGRVREGIEELEDVLKISLGDTEAGVLEGVVDRKGVGGGADFAEGLHFGREVGGI